jgi:hypothetical protein
MSASTIPIKPLLALGSYKNKLSSTSATLAKAVQDAEAWRAIAIQRMEALSSLGTTLAKVAGGMENIFALVGAPHHSSDLEAVAKMDPTKIVTTAEDAEDLQGWARDNTQALITMLHDINEHFATADGASMHAKVTGLSPPAGHQNADTSSGLALADLQVGGHAMAVQPSHISLPPHKLSASGGEKHTTPPPTPPHKHEVKEQHEPRDTKRDSHKGKDHKDHKEKNEKPSHKKH